jgi:toxin ParE1/3/4
LQLTWSAIASEDRDRIFDYLAERNPVAALQLDGRFDEAVELLTSHPFIGRQGRVEGTRELVMSDAVYIIVYQTSEKDIVILRLLHGAQQWPEIPLEG